MFDLDERLRTDTVLVGELALNSVLLARDATYPWVILVPRRSAITEIHQLKPADRVLLMQESCVLAEVMMALYQPDKLNIAALGNQVPQLHVHHVARFKTDPTWPRPVWGAAPSTKYKLGVLNHRLADLRAALAPHGLGNP